MSKRFIKGKPVGDLAAPPYSLRVRLEPGMKEKHGGAFIPTQGELSLDYRAAYRSDKVFLSTVIHELLECINQIRFHHSLSHDDIIAAELFLVKELWDRFGVRISDADCVVPYKENTDAT